MSKTKKKNSSSYKKSKKSDVPGTVEVKKVSPYIGLLPSSTFFAKNEETTIVIGDKYFFTEKVRVRFEPLNPTLRLVKAEIQNIPKFIKPSTIQIQSLTDPNLKLKNYSVIPGINHWSQCFLPNWIGGGIEISVKKKEVVTVIRGIAVQVFNSKLILKDIENANKYHLIGLDDSFFVNGSLKFIEPIPANYKSIPQPPPFLGSTLICLFEYPATVENFSAQEQLLEFSYFVNNLQTSINYSAKINSSMNAMQLTISFLIENNSKREYNNVTIKRFYDNKFVSAFYFEGEFGSFSSMKTDETGHILLPIVNEIITTTPKLIANSKSALALLPNVPIRVDSVFISESTEVLPSIFPITRSHTDDKYRYIYKALRFSNSRNIGLGFTLVEGPIQIQKLNTNSIGYTDVVNATVKKSLIGQDVEIKFNSKVAIAITIEVKITQFSYDRKTSTITESFEIILTNNYTTTEEVLVKENVYRWNEYQIQSDPPFTQISSNKIGWRVRVAPASTSIIRYMVRYLNVPQVNLIN
eukprot:TRINITY_DN902_c0_g3_i1.p1 TRINITY_DN902_c0_g3~~TRINITY_DN902_c0_g3_i1.p1  ORF type:complete len:525 (-),score=228.23 TRINITY_DN902_c0_g3_i1:105-1679(-)